MQIYTCIHVYVIRHYTYMYIATYHHRYVGWVVDFIGSRKTPTVSMLNAYTRLTYLRRIPPSVLKEIQNSSSAQTDWSMGVFIQKYTASAAVGAKGTGGYRLLNECKTNVKRYTKWMRKAVPDYLLIRAFVKDTFKDHGAQEPTEVAVITGGLEINGSTPWKVGTACLYTNTENALGSGCGVVRSIIRWENEFDAYLLMCIQPHMLLSFGPLRAACTISSEHTAEEPVWMSWTTLTHNCKIVPYVGTIRGRDDLATLVLVHATSPEKDAAHYASVKSITSRAL
jgi:hypothetical protein